jgi:hypothetical protein
VPDVKMWRDPNIPMTSKDEFIAELQKEVARQMSCWVPAKTSKNYEYYELNWQSEIDVPVFDVIQGRSNSFVILEVAAFPYEDRMRDIKQRIRNIAVRIADLLGLDPEDVSITFIKVDFDCWTTAVEEPA